MTTLSSASYPMKEGGVIHRLPVEAFPGMWANVYVVETGDWLVLIDSGSGSDASNANLEAGFSQIERRLEDVTHVLLTHGHIDHYGGLKYLRERTAARVGVHELDLQTISHHEQRLGVLARRLDAFLVQAGVPPARRTELLQMYRFTKALYRSVPVDFAYEAQGMQFGPFEMIHMPGHCPGHVALKLQDVLFCGDLVLAGITPHQSPEELMPFMGVRHYLNSLSILMRWGAGVRLVLNGHDETVNDLSGRVREIRQNLSRRIHQTLEALVEPRTVAEVTAEVYGDMGGYNALLVIEKIGAYVEYLYQSGLLEITNLAELETDDQTVPVRYRRLRDVPQEQILPKERTHVFF